MFVFVWYTSPLLFLLISAYFSSLKNVCKLKNTLTSLASFCSETKTNLSVLQNQQSGTFIKLINKNNNGNYRPLLMLLMAIFCLQWCSQLCKC